MLRQVVRIPAYLARMSNPIALDIYNSSSQISQRHDNDQSHMILKSLLSSPQKNLKKNMEGNLEIFSQKLAYSPSCYPSFHALTNSCAKRYSTAQDMRCENNEQTQFSEEEVQDMIVMLSDPKKVQGLFNEDGRLQKKTVLARKLFVKGIDRAELTPLILQERFESARNKEDKLVFYPTETTSEIFRIILREKVGTNFYLTSQRGIGKSFSVALFTFLMRMSPNCRVLYIDNPWNLIGNWRSLRRYFEIAFQEELKDPKLQEILSRSFAGSFKKNSALALASFFTSLCDALMQKNIKLFIIIDQVNVFESIKISSSRANNSFDADAYALNLYQTLKLFDYQKTTRVLVASTTNKDDIAFPIDEVFSEVAFDPKYLSKDVAKRFISENFEGDINDLFIEKVYAMTGGHFLLMKNLMMFLKMLEGPLEDPLQCFENFQIPVLERDLNKFISSSDARTEAMMTVFYALMLKPNFTDKKEKKFLSYFQRDLIDKRYIIYRSEGSVSLLHPLIIKSLKMAFADPKIVKKVLYLFPEHRHMVGLLFENLILGELKHSILCCLELDARPIHALEYQGEERIFSSFRINPIYHEENLDFPELGLYRPEYSTRQIFDCFVSTPEELYAIQIIPKVTAERIAKLVTAFQVIRKETSQHKIPVENTCQEYTLELNDEPQNHKEEAKEEPVKVLIEKKDLDIVRQVSHYTKANKKVLRMLFVSLDQNPVQDETLKIFQRAKIQDEFYLADVSSHLLSVGFTKDNLEIMSRGIKEE